MLVNCIVIAQVCFFVGIGDIHYVEQSAVAIDLGFFLVVDKIETPSVRLQSGSFANMGGIELVKVKR